MHKSAPLFLLAALVTMLTACTTRSHVHRLDGKIFHAISVLELGGPGTIYFGLYKDHTYQVCVSGRVTQDCYSGGYSLDGDTLTLEGLSRNIRLKYNRLLLCRYAQKDSTYWQWKYGAADSAWRDGYEYDRGEATGDAWQLGYRNMILKDSTEIHFTVLLDSLATYH